MRAEKQKLSIQAMKEFEDLCKATASQITNKSLTEIYKSLKANSEELEIWWDNQIQLKVFEAEIRDRGLPID